MNPFLIAVLALTPATITSISRFLLVTAVTSGRKDGRRRRDALDALKILDRPQSA